MTAVTFDFRDFERTAKAMQATVDQIPFALARSMNDALAASREQIVERTWPSRMTVRNSRFMGVAMRREFASKRRLSVSLFDTLGRGNLTLHEDGGSRRPRGASIAVPSSTLLAKRSGKGVPKGLRPGALPNAFRKGDVLYQRTGKYQKAGKVKRDGTRRAPVDGRGLKLMYVLAPSAPIKAEVPFHADFDRVMTQEVWRSFAPRLQAAMAGRCK